MDRANGDGFGGMMPVSSSFYTSPYAPFRLSVQEKFELRRVVHTLLEECLPHYETHCAQPADARVPPEQWKMVRQRGEFSLYLEAKGPWKHPNDTGQLDVMLGTGPLAGTLDDILYATVEPTIGDVRIHAAYDKNSSLRTAILEIIDEPTADEPFRTTSLRWLSKDMPLGLSLVAKHRDTTYVDATGTTTLRNGERVGFHVLHTVHFPELPPLKEYVRIGLSIVAVWRQDTESMLDTYCRAILDIKEAMLKPLVVQSVAASLVCSVDLMEIARRKKMAWLLRQERGQAGSISTGTDSSAGSAPLPQELECNACKKTFKMLIRQKRRCNLCDATVCRACSVKKTLLALRYDGTLCKSSARLCVACIQRANALPAQQIARQELVGASGSPRASRLAPCLPDQAFSLNAESGSGGSASVSRSTSSSGSERGHP